MAPHASAATMSLGPGPEQRPVSPRLALPAGGWLAHHDVGPARRPRPLAARDAGRGRLLALGAGLLAVGALVVTARSRARSRAGQLADRYAVRSLTCVSAASAHWNASPVIRRDTTPR